MIKKKNKLSVINYVLPSNNSELESFAINNKLKLMEQIVQSIEYAVDNNLSDIEGFQFKNSDFIITISEKDYLINIDNIFNHYMQCEAYEYCPRIIKLKETIKEKYGQIINDEK